MPQTLKPLIMSDMQKYIDTCIETADVTAQRLRGLANIIGREAGQVDADTQDLLRMSKDAIKRMATDMQNLVHTMADQLEQERAEAERMSCLYAMARKDIQDLKGHKERLTGLEVQLRDKIRDLKAQ